MKKLLFIVFGLLTCIFAEPFAFSNFYIQSDKMVVRPGDRVFLTANYTVINNIAYRLTWTDEVDSKFIFDDVHKAIWIAPHERTKTKIKAVLEDFYGNVLTDEFEIEVKDGSIPIANDDTNVAIWGEDDGGMFLSSKLLVNDTDPDGDVLKVINVKAFSSTRYSFDLSDDKTKIMFNPGSYFNHLSVGMTQKAKFTYTISDGRGNTASANAYLTVYGIDDAPKISDDVLSIKLPTTHGFVNILRNDGDADDNASLEVYQVGTNHIPQTGVFTYTGNYGVALFSRDGNVTYYPDMNNASIMAMGSSDRLYEYISNIYINEKVASIALPQNLTITIVGVNDDPIAVDDNVTNMTGEVFVDNFEINASGWSNNNIVTNGELSKFLGRFGGSSGAQDVFKVYVLGSHNAYTNVEIELDFYEIDSWDGETFIIFVNNDIRYEKAYKAGASFNENSGTFTSTNLFNGWGSENIHKFKFLATTDSFGNLKLGFGSTLTQGLNDESYGIDNVKLTTLPLTANKQLNIKIPADLLLLNDSDPDGDTISISSVGGVVDENNISIANAYLDANNKFISFSSVGSASSSTSSIVSFKYTIEDSNNAKDTATVRMGFYTEDLDLSDDYISLYENKIITTDGNIFLNDVNHNGTTLKVVNPDLNKTGSYGYLEINQDGSYKYTLDKNNINIQHRDILRDIFTLGIVEEETGALKDEKLIFDIHGVIKANDDNISTNYGEYTTVELDKTKYLGNDDYRVGLLKKVEVDTKAYVKGTMTVSGDVSYDTLSNKITYTPNFNLPKMLFGETRTLSIDYEIFAKMNTANIIDGIVSMSDTATIDINITSAIVFYRCPPGTMRYDLATNSCIQLAGTDFRDLRNWTSTTNRITDANWTVSADGSSVTQSVNGIKPSIFLAPYDFQYLSFEGEMKIISGDDDFIGFAFGYSSGKYILFDWKGITQNSAIEGFILSYADIDTSINTNNNWAHNNETTILRDNLGSGMGWRHGMDYTIKLSYTINKVRVEVNGVSVIEYTLDSTLPVDRLPIGQIGFYNYSQGNVVYKNFRIVPYDCEANGYVTSVDKETCISQ